VVVAIVGMLAKKQLDAGVAPQAGDTPEAAVPAGTPQQQVQQVQQVQQAVQGVMQQARPMPDDDK